MERFYYDDVDKTLKPTNYQQFATLCRRLKNNKKKLLDLAIEKWEICVEHASEKDFCDDGWRTCALCQVFNNPQDRKERTCVGCPIHAVTGAPFCLGTPYAQSGNRHRAKRMLQFLKALRKVYDYIKE